MSEAPKTQLAPIAAGSRGLTLASLDDYWRFATAVAKSGLAPKGLQSPEAILIAVQMGAEVGLPPMASLQNVAVINGRPSLWGDAMLAVCRSSGVFDEATFEEVIDGVGGDMVAMCRVRRFPDGKVCTRSFSVADAEAAGLWGKQGPWQQYPKRMLQMRARSWALRDTFGDALRGFKAAEEIQDVEPAPVEVKVTEVVGDPTVPFDPLDKLADDLEASQNGDQAPAKQPEPKDTPKGAETQQAATSQSTGTEDSQPDKMLAAEFREVCDRLKWRTKEVGDWLESLEVFEGQRQFSKLNRAAKAEAIKLAKAIADDIDSKKAGGKTEQETFA